MKYNEEINLQETLEYMETTYSQHYKGDGKVMLLDLFCAEGIAPDFFRASAMKYITRFGKKEGKNKKDLMKAIHFILLLWEVSLPQESTKVKRDKFLDNDQS